MSEGERIAERLRSIVDGGAWHGPALAPLLRGLTAEQAAQRPVPGAHTIAEIVRHAVAWQEIVARRAAGEDLRPTAAEDWPPVADGAAVWGEAAWSELRERLARDAARLAVEVAGLSDRALAASVVRRRYTVAHLLNGLIEHHAYHAGQIALLKRALGLTVVEEAA